MGLACLLSDAGLGQLGSMAWLDGHWVCGLLSSVEIMDVNWN